jgi:hypothetical protein
MKKISSLLIFKLSFNLLSYPQTLRRPVAADYIGAGAYSVIQTDVFSFTANQASLARITHFSGGIYSERRYMLSELSLYDLAFALPTPSGNFGIKANYFGSPVYNETQACLAYARSLSRMIDIGVQFNYNAVKLAGYGHASAITVEAGAILHLSEKLHAGIHINNPAGAKYNKGDDERLPFVYASGLGYDASDKFFVSAEVEKEEDQPVNVNAGLQYKLIPRIMARAGLASATSTVWLGLGVIVKSFRIDVAASCHPHLGITPGLMLVFFGQPGTPKNEQAN